MRIKSKAVGKIGSVLMYSLAYTHHSLGIVFPRLAHAFAFATSTLPEFTTQFVQGTHVLHTPYYRCVYDIELAI